MRDASDSTNREHAEAHALWPLLRCVTVAVAAALRGGGGDCGSVVFWLYGFVVVCVGLVTVCVGCVSWLCELVVCVLRVCFVLCVRVDGVRV